MLMDSSRHWQLDKKKEITIAACWVSWLNQITIAGEYGICLSRIVSIIYIRIMIILDGPALNNWISILDGTY